MAIISVLLTMSALSFAVEDGSGEDESVLKFEAGGKEFRDEGDYFINRFYDYVTAWHRGSVLKAREGIYHSGTGDISFYGETSFRDSLRQVFADTLLYNENSHEALALGNVRVIEGDRTLIADRLRYNKDMKFIIASGSVYINDDSTRAVLQGESAEFSDSTGVGYITGNPRLEKLDDNDMLMTVACEDTILFLENERIIMLWNNVVAVRDSMKLSCADTLEIRELDNSIRLWNDVVATKDSLTAWSTFAAWNDSSETLVMSGEPKIEYRVNDSREGAPSALTTVNTVAGDTIRVSISERKIQGTTITGSVKSVTASTDSSGATYDKSVIESAVMRLVMEDDTISMISAEGTAQSYYYRNATAEESRFVNSASGDTLSFFFDKGALSEMKIYGYGGSPGAGKYLNYEPFVESAASDSTQAADAEEGSES